MRHAVTLILLLLSCSVSAAEPLSVMATEKALFFGMVDDIEAGLRIIQTEKMVTGTATSTPTALDKQADGACVHCFQDVLGEPVSDPKWTKKGNTYVFSGDEFQSEFTYDAASGKLVVAKSGKKKKRK